MPIIFRSVGSQYAHVKLTLSRYIGSPRKFRASDGAAVAVDETAIQIVHEQFWLYAALGADSKFLLGVRVLRWRGTCPTSAFLSELNECHDHSETEFLMDVNYLTALVRTDPSGHHDGVTRNLIEKWFQTLTMRADCFHSTWMDGRASAARWFAAFVYYYNSQRPHQVPNNYTPVEKVKNN